jgi:hypothetical protein
MEVQIQEEIQMERAPCLDKYKPTQKKILSRKTYQRQPQQVERSICYQHGVDPPEIDPTRSAQRMQPAQWSHADHMLLLAPPAIMELADSFFLRPASCCCFDR